MKILSPAGNFESLKMAIFNGADEVYLGISDFNARNNIDGFDLSSLKEAVDFAHIFDIKMDLAINILFSDDELQSALDTIVDAYNIGVDAFIIQDLALAKLVHDSYPQIEIHASTQMGIHNLEGVKEIQEYGFKRVVLARETPLEEIKRIRENSDVELEYFAQGALCVSFSGNCYLSSYECNASGNRGRCKQLCRLPYLLLKNGKKIKSGYLLSAKDFSMTDRLEDLKKAGIDVLKIEGRARRPFYVAMATREYYNALHGNKVSQENLKLAFNREYTAGYFDGNGKIISEFQNHIGIPIGKVERVKCGKKFNEVCISSKRELSPKSTFKFFADKKEKTTLTAYDLKPAGRGLYVLTTTQRVNEGDKVNLIVDNAVETEVLAASKKRKIDIKIFAKSNERIKATIDLKSGTIEVLGDICEVANSRPITFEEIKGNFAKSEIFEAKVEIVELESVFMPKQRLNEFRRSVFAKVLEEIANAHRHGVEKVEVKNDYKAKKFTDFQFVEKFEENFVRSNVIYSPETYEVENVEKFVEKCKNLGKKAYLDTPNFALKKDIELLSEIIQKTGIAIVANNYYALGFDAEIIIGAGLNVYNLVTARIYDKPIITAESSVGTKMLYPYMTLRHCPMKSHLNASCEKCPYSEGYVYKMESGKELKLKRKKLSTCTFYLVD